MVTGMEEKQKNNCLKDKGKLAYPYLAKNQKEHIIYKVRFLILSLILK
jgi:hypothetical protein